MKKSLILAAVLAALMTVGTFAAETDAPAPVIEGMVEVVPEENEDNAVLLDRVALTGVTIDEEGVSVVLSAEPVCITKLAFMLEGEENIPVTVSVSAANDPEAEEWTPLLIAQTVESVDGYFTADLLNEEAYAYYTVSFAADAGLTADVKEIAVYTEGEAVEVIEEVIEEKNINYTAAGKRLAGIANNFGRKFAFVREKVPVNDNVSFRPESYEMIAPLWVKAII